MAKRRPKKPNPKKKPAPKPKPASRKAPPKKAPRKPVARSAPKKRATRAPRKVEAVRKDSRGHYRDVKTGKAVPAARAKRFKTFYDAQGRRRKTKGGGFAGGKKIAPTSRARRRAGLVSAYKPGEARDRGAAQEKLLKRRRKRRTAPTVTKMRYTGKRRTKELADLFGINLARPVRGDFATVIEAQGVELGRGSFFVADPIGDKEENRNSIWQGVERATRFVRELSPPRLVALMVTVVVEGGEIGSQTLITRSDESAEVKGAVMAAIFSALGEAGLDASEGNVSPDRQVQDLGVEVVAYELE